MCQVTMLPFKAPLEKRLKLAKTVWEIEQLLKRARGIAFAKEIHSAMLPTNRPDR
jgi:hypothetical protein